MYQRKIQLIAGTTYSVSLPKEWVKSNNLKEKSVVSIKALNDQSLLIFPSNKGDEEDDKTFTLNIDKYGLDIDQILFSLYYRGFEEIILFSEKEMTEEVKAGVKKTLTNMSGTEILYEDRYRIKLKVLLDRNKLDIKQMFFRIALIIGSSIDNIKSGVNLEILRMNEDEVDRLYHLIAKTIFLSSLYPDLLKSSKIVYSSNTMPYLLIAKRLENVADNIYDLGPLVVNCQSLKEVSQILDGINTHVLSCVNYLVTNHEEIFRKTDKAVFLSFQKRIRNLKENNLRIFLLNSVRYLIDIEEELVNVYFYRILISKGLL